jgi:2-keto-3-deoxy-L-rhamnonate aldolase RhmA
MKIRPNRVKERLAAGQVATIIAGTNEPDLIDQLGTLDVDGIWLEGEHGGVDFADLGNLTRACDIWGKTSVVRVQDNDYATIYRTLDRGAQAIVVPHVNNRREAETVVEAAKFAPVGKRGMFTSRQGFGVEDYLKTANDQSALMILIEDIAAVKGLDEIVKVDHIDVFFVAPGDLAASMGHIGQMDPPRRAEGDRRRHRHHRQGRPHRGHAGEPGQRGALHQARRARGDDAVLPLDSGRAQGPDGARGEGGEGVASMRRARVAALLVAAFACSRRGRPTPRRARIRSA